jgi:ABC-type multidrug transport system ATPase subunit
LIGFVAHESGIYFELTARENLLFAARMQGIAEARRRVAERLEDCGLVRQADLPAGQLSRGQRQRLTIARSLIHDPPIVILDEPFAGLDAQGRAWLEVIIGDLSRAGRAVCLTGHDEDQWQRIAQRRVDLHTTKCWGSPNRLRSVA